MERTDQTKAVFLDRDGTLVEEVNFLSRVEDLEIFPYTAEALRLLKDAGFLVIVVTNQSGIGRGIYDADAMHAIHAEMQSRLANMIDAFYFCPHLPCDGCTCRKPGLGMIEQAAADFPIEFNSSWMVGDKNIDVETAHNAGMKGAMVLTGYGRAHAKHLTVEPDIIAEDLLEAVQAMLR